MHRDLVMLENDLQKYCIWVQRAVKNADRTLLFIARRIQHRHLCVINMEYWWNHFLSTVLWHFTPVRKYVRRNSTGLFITVTGELSFGERSDRLGEGVKREGESH